MGSHSSDLALAAEAGADKLHQDLLGGNWDTGSCSKPAFLSHSVPLMRNGGPAAWRAAQMVGLIEQCGEPCLLTETSIMQGFVSCVRNSLAHCRDSLHTSRHSGGCG